MNANAQEQTLVLIKPDALKNSLTGYVLSQLSEFHTGLRFAANKIVNVGRLLAEEHYAEHRGKAFFFSLLEYIMGVSHYPERPASRRVVALVYSGPNAVSTIRNIAGPTNPHVARDTRPGSIRALGTVVLIKDAEGNVLGDRLDNLIHASATVEEAEREIKLWFLPTDIPPTMRAYETEICDQHYYLLDGALHTEYAPGMMCLVAPGDIVWKTDMEELRAVAAGQAPADRVNAVAAKYLINRVPESL